MSEKAWQQLVEAAQHGDGFAITLVGLHLVNTKADVEKGEFLIRQAADGKNVIWAKHIRTYMNSCNQWQLPLQNQITLDDYALAQFFKYISNNNSWAMAILGSLYYQGISVPRDVEQGKMLLSCARTLDLGRLKENLWANELIEQYGFTPQGNLLERIKYLANYDIKYKDINISNVL